MRRRATDLPSADANRVAPIRLGHAAIGGLGPDFKLPERFLPARAVGFDHAKGRRRKLAHALEDRHRRRHDGVPAHVMMQRRRIDRGIDIARGQERRQRRREAKPAGRFRIIERLDAEPIARQDHASGLALPDREGKHAVEALDAARAPFRVSFQDDLGVALREKAVALRLKFAAQFAVIVDAAVEDDCQPQLRIDHRLLRCGREIDDAQSAVTEGDTVL